MFERERVREREIESVSNVFAYDLASLIDCFCKTKVFSDKSHLLKGYNS